MDEDGMRPNHWFGLVLCVLSEFWHLSLGGRTDVSHKNPVALIPRGSFLEKVELLRSFNGLFTRTKKWKGELANRGSPGKVVTKCSSLFFYFWTFILSFYIFNVFLVAYRHHSTSVKWWSWYNISYYHWCSDRHNDNNLSIRSRNTGQSRDHRQQ